MSIERMKEYVNNQNFWEVFEDMLKEKITEQEKALTQISKVYSGDRPQEVELFRRQGRIYAFNNLLKLKDQIKALDKSGSK